jgi:uncharacterized protein YjbJ (UPF0337 family)
MRKRTSPFNGEVYRTGHSAGIAFKYSVKGTIDDAVGRARRQAGEWTCNTEEEIKGAAQQVKGKAEKAAGNVRDVVHNSADSPDRDVDDEYDREEEIDRTHRK